MDDQSLAKHSLTPNLHLVLTSLTFIIPTTIAAYYQEWIHYAALLNLTIVSCLYHSTKNTTLFWLDQLACFALVATTIRLSLLNNHRFVPITASIYTLGIYYGGYYLKTFMWSTDKMVATLYHMSMHAVINFTTCYVINKYY